MEKHFKLFGLKLISWGDNAPSSLFQDNTPKVNSGADSSQPDSPKIVPPGRISIPPQNNQYIPSSTEFQILIPETSLDLIPYIRTLVAINPNVSQALSNIVELGNTGHKIQFDPSVLPDQIVLMQQHLDEVVKYWSPSKASANGIVDKIMRQIMISGALSVEWVPKTNLSGIQMIAMVSPETVRWGYDKVKNQYKPFQTVIGSIIPDINTSSNLIPLNTNTFKYYALNGDTDIPYGIPPYLAALDSQNTQKDMLANLKFIMKQMGLAGFMEMMLDKPDQIGGESWEAWEARLTKFLDDAKVKAQSGFSDGITVGFKDDTVFKFNATSKSMGGIKEFFELNEMLFASGLNMDSSMLGRNYGSSESQITIVFTKLLSQLNTIQQMVATCLEYGYALELRLAGFKFKSLKVAFNASTALDELKYEQSEEIRVRNANQLYADGIISQEQYAQRVGYEKPNQQEPRYIPTTRETPQDAAARQKAENAGKNEGDKKSNQKKKSQDVKPKK